jgi:capsular exopolysaccharide synthesis family protein
MLTSDPTFAQARAALVPNPDTIDSILGFVRRHFALAVITTMIAWTGWAIHAQLTAAHFVATAKLLVDPDAPAQLANQLANRQQQPSFPDTNEVPTQVDLLSSDYVARKVINDLDLTHDADLSRSGPLHGIRLTLTNLIGSVRDDDLPAPLVTTLALLRSYLDHSTEQSADQSEEQMRRTLNAFRGSLKIYAVPSSHIINVSFSSASAQRAAQIANAVANTMVRLELTADKEATQKAGAVSRGRLQDLRAQVEKAQKELSDFKGTNNFVSQAEVRDLVARIQMLRNAYDTALKLDAESPRPDVPITKTRLIAAAADPLEPDRPNVALVFAVVTLVGATFGLGLGALRDSRDRTFRTRDQVTSLLGVDCLALVPRLKRRNKLRRGFNAGTPNKLFSKNNHFIEALRSVELAIEHNTQGLSGANTIIGVTSALPGEGKSTVAAALAFHMRQRVKHVLLVDCDMRNPYLSRVLSPKAHSGLSELTMGDVSRDDAVLNGPTESVNFLPARSDRRNGHAAPALVDSYSMRDAFASLRRQYDLIFLDLPPLAPVVDARAIADLIDGYLVVVEWGETKIDVVQHALAHAKSLNEKLMGIVLNKVELSRLGRYDRHLTQFYSTDYYFRNGHGLWTQ